MDFTKFLKLLDLTIVALPVVGSTVEMLKLIFSSNQEKIERAWADHFVSPGAESFLSPEKKDELNKP